MANRPLQPFYALILSVILTAAAQAAPHGIMWATGKGPRHSEAAAGGLRYYGGPVLDHVKVYAILWGPSVSKETQANIGPFYQNMLDSAYMDWLSEYDTNVPAVDGRQGTNQHIGRGTFGGTLMIQPINTAKKLTDAMVRIEIEAQITAGKLPPNDDESLYMVYFPANVRITEDGGGSCATFCGYHDAFKTAGGSSVFYGVLPECGSGCDGGSSAFDSLTVTSSHECTEAVTDPFPTPGTNPAYPQAWNSSNGDEIGDLCEDGSNTLAGHGITSKVQWEWDNSINACSKGPWGGSNLAAASLPRPFSTNLDQPHPLLEALRQHPDTIFGR